MFWRGNLQQCSARKCHNVLVCLNEGFASSECTVKFAPLLSDVSGES
jgi:hypothetical protein